MIETGEIVLVQHTLDYAFGHFLTSYEITLHQDTCSDTDEPFQKSFVKLMMLYLLVLRLSCFIMNTQQIYQNSSLSESNVNVGINRDILIYWSNTWIFEGLILKLSGCFLMFLYLSSGEDEFVDSNNQKKTWLFDVLGEINSIILKVFN